LKRTQDMQNYVLVAHHKYPATLLLTVSVVLAEKTTEYVRIFTM